MITHQLDPLWIAPIYEDNTGQDFLGLRAVSARITDYLLPGIITITDRARYYSFFSWLLTEYMHQHPKGWSLGRFIKRREQIFALANIAYSAKNDGAMTINQLNGSLKLTEHWRKYADRTSFPITCDNYLKAAMGGYNDYAGAMRALHITRNPEEEDRLVILPKGRQLARAFERAIHSTRYFEKRRLYDSSETIPKVILEEYGEACHLNRVPGRPDHRPLVEVLFAFNVPHKDTWSEPEQDNLENMRGSLGLILEMLNQAKGPFWDDDYRQAVAYAGCGDYDAYRPSKQLRPFLAHWRMYQLREYYVYALYAWWVFFLKWIARSGPTPMSALDTALGRFHLGSSLSKGGLKLKTAPATKWVLQDWFEQLLSACGIEGTTFSARCNALARRSQTQLNEHALYGLIAENGGQDPDELLGLGWLLLSALYLRLRGIQSQDPWHTWHWAENGGAGERCMAGFVRDLDSLIESGQTISAAWQQLFRDYIISQHIVTSLEKWRNRNANTFHFNYDQGILEWVRLDENALEMTASRFPQASVALFDLGLYKLDKDSIPQLTALGKQVVARVLETTSG